MCIPGTEFHSNRQSDRLPGLSFSRYSTHPHSYTMYMDSEVQAPHYGPFQELYGLPNDPIYLHDPNRGFHSIKRSSAVLHQLFHQMNLRHPSNLRLLDLKQLYSNRYHANEGLSKPSDVCQYPHLPLQTWSVHHNGCQRDFYNTVL